MWFEIGRRDHHMLAREWGLGSVRVRPWAGVSRYPQSVAFESNFKDFEGFRWENREKLFRHKIEAEYFY